MGNLDEKLDKRNLKKNTIKNFFYNFPQFMYEQGVCFSGVYKKGKFQSLYCCTKLDRIVTYYKNFKLNEEYTEYYNIGNYNNLRFKFKINNNKIVSEYIKYYHNSQIHIKCYINEDNPFLLENEYVEYDINGDIIFKFDFNEINFNKNLDEIDIEKYKDEIFYHPNMGDISLKDYIDFIKSNNKNLKYIF